jgi:hypothetical protein
MEGSSENKSRTEARRHGGTERRGELRDRNHGGHGEHGKLWGKNHGRVFGQIGLAQRHGGTERRGELRDRNHGGHGEHGKRKRDGVLFELLFIDVKDGNGRLVGCAQRSQIGLR